MKQFIYFILLLVSIVACSCTNSDKGGCSSDGTVCVKIRPQEPIRYLEPIDIVITVSSTTDISGLGISLMVSPLSIIVGDAEGTEEGVELWRGESGIDWSANISAGGIVSLTRKVSLPAEDGAYQLIVHASTPQLRAIDSLVLYQTGEAINFYLPGTEIPITQGPLPNISPEILKTVRARPTPTLYPTHIPTPTNINTPTPWVYPPPATPPMDAPGEGPYP